jgi:hypothetical protein
MASLVTLNRVGGAVQDNVDFNGKKPALKKGSPAAKVVSGTKQTFGKTSDAQIRRRKTASANATAVSSAIGLGAGSAAGAGVLSRKIGAAKGNLKLMKTGRKVADVAVPLTLVGGAISGVNGFNNASLQRADARRRQQAVLHKAYDPEYNRQRRNEIESKAATVGGGAILGGAGYHAVRNEKNHAGRIGAAGGEVQSARDFLDRKTAKYVQHKGHLNTAQDNLERAQQAKEHAVANGARGSTLGQHTRNVTRRAADVETKSKKLFRSENNVKAAHSGYLKAASGVRQAKKLRMIGRAKSGAIGLAGAGALVGASQLRKKPSTTSWASYSPRYRPGS